VAARRSRPIGAGAVLVIVLIIAALAILKVQHHHFRAPAGSGCVVRGQRFQWQLYPSQASIAATIAGVAAQRAMPERAITIAYAAALQESYLENLTYGDRDSVGVFQQRPSQGWGTRQQLLDPVYASTRFFLALAAIPHYERLRVYKAAQAVQHSADGSAYGQWVKQGADMAAGFSGRRPRTVSCWYGIGFHGRGQVSAASIQLRRTFGPLTISHAGDPLARVRVRGPDMGWAIAAWLVSHAGRFKIRQVSYQGYQWTAAHGKKGWTARPRAHDAAGSRTAVTFG
jgi:hypothetical protein